MVRSIVQICQWAYLEARNAAFLLFYIVEQQLLSRHYINHALSFPGVVIGSGCKACAEAMSAERSHWQHTLYRRIRHVLSERLVRHVMSQKVSMFMLLFDTVHCSRRMNCSPPCSPP